MNLSNLRKAQRIVCEKDFMEYLGTDSNKPNEFHGSVDDLIWNRAQLNELTLSLEDYENLFISNPSYETANMFWMKSAITA